MTVYLGDNTHIENCIVESRDTIRANSYYCGEERSEDRRGEKRTDTYYKSAG